MLHQVTRSPSLVRVIPFVVFVVLTFCQDLFPGPWKYWVYALKTLAGAGMIAAVWPFIPEMQWKLSWEAIVVGALVFVVWVGVDPFLVKLGLPNSYPKLFGLPEHPWNPHLQFAAPLAWFFIVVRIVGSTFVVPPLEEVFFRSWLYRYIANPDFQAVPLGRFLWLPFLATSIVFGLEHREWLAGIIAGFAYAGLVCWKKRLGDAITAHAVTNLLLGLWVVARGQWQYW